VNALPFETPSSRPAGSLPDGPVAQYASAFGVRRYPYPYEAALAICSDLDETPNRDVYYETAKFLNTTRMTSMGRGVGLEVGNTIYFDMPRGQFSYWNTDENGRALVRDLIRSGHIDCLHSYGDHATQRGHVERALNALARDGCRLEVWIDHGTAPTNFGPDIMRGRGDVPGSDVYHADLSCEFGVRFVWIGRVTSVVGQDSPASLKGIREPAHPLPSLKTLSKEFAKCILARMGSAKYGMHAGNALLRRGNLRDGRHVHEFIRSNPHWGGVSTGETADGIADILVPRILDRLVARKGVCILYTHLGKIRGRAIPFERGTIEAFRTLSRYHSDGRILVTTTSRMLKYTLAAKELSADLEVHGNGCNHIRIRTLHPDDLDGLTIYTTIPEKTVLTINGRSADRLQINPPDRTGRKSVSLPWRKIEFPLL
jgi:hypothetical protein